MAGVQSKKPKRILVREDRINLQRLFNNKTLDELISNIETLRQQYAEYIFLYGYDVRVNYDSWGTALIKVVREETPKEFEERLERNRIATEKRRATAERKRISEQKEIEDKERKLYEKLKAKFGQN